MDPVLLLTPCCRAPVYRLSSPLLPGQRMTASLARHLTGRAVERGECVSRCPRCGAMPNLSRLIQQEANG